jgi:hypothetical protein
MELLRPIKSFFILGSVAQRREEKRTHNLPLIVDLNAGEGRLVEQVFWNGRKAVIGCHDTARYKRQGNG